MYNFESKVFKKEEIQMGHRREYIVRGGRNLFPLLPKALEGIRSIAVLGWGPQGAAQACNLRDSLEGTGIRVIAGLREGSPSRAAAEREGFSAEKGTLLETMEAAATGDMVILLVSDSAQTIIYKELFSVMRPGTTLGLSHGFLAGYLNLMGEKFPEDINVIAVCPKGMGPSVRRLYEQGKAVNGAGINCSFAVEQDISGRATDYALAWAIAIGAPAIFKTDLILEYKSDISGERSVLLGGVYGLTEALFRLFREQGASPEEAFIRSAESLTGSISRTISREGLLGLYNSFSQEEQRIFESAYSAAYDSFYKIIDEIYEEVETGVELHSMVLAGKRHEKQPMETVGDTPLWRTGEKVRNAGTRKVPPGDPVTAGFYAALMTAQGDLLLKKGHPLSEIANESVIEAVDSLNPYMHYKGIAYMIDNCSVNARVGARKWGSRFDYILTQEAIPALGNRSINPEKIEAFKENILHKALETAALYRPPVDISLHGVC